jgi:hypothetical protein
VLSVDRHSAGPAAFYWALSRPDETQESVPICVCVKQILMKREYEYEDFET